MIARNHPRRVARAFTLIELIATVAVIAILIAISITAISRSRSAALAVACSANLRSLHTATMLYMDGRGRGRFPACDSPTVINGTFTFERVRAPFEAIEDELGLSLSPVVDPPALSWPPYRSPQPQNTPVRRSVLACPDDEIYGPLWGVSYEFVPSQFMLNMLTGAVDPSRVLPESLRYERQEGPTVVWLDLHIDAHPNAPAGLFGGLGVLYDGSVGWYGGERRYAN